MVAVAVAVILSLAIPAAAPSAERRSSPPVANASAGPPPRITSILKNLATRTSRIRLRQRNAHWSQRRVARISKRIVKRWVKDKAKECPNAILPDAYFCNRPPQPRWGLGVALSINGDWPYTYRSPWSTQTAVQALRPGVTFWLTCWSPGTTIQNAIARSNLWYRLTNGLYVSDGWLSTGTNYAIPGVRRC